MRKYFVSVKNVEELKREYRKLAKRLHPDLGGNEKEFIAMKDEYDMLFEELKTKKDGENNGRFQEIIDELLKFGDIIEIEIVGSWIWIDGNTYPLRDKLGRGGLGLQYSGGKKKWYWTEDTFKKSRYKQKSMDELREVYGSVKVSGQGQEKQAIAG